MDHQFLSDTLLQLGYSLRERLREAMRQQGSGQLSAVHRQSHDDTIYVLDQQAEDWLLPALAEVAPTLGGLVLIAEGVGEPGATAVLPAGLAPEAAALRLIIDPVDGTRGLMYDKRSAFFLAAVAPNRGPGASLRDLEVAVMVELPTSRSLYADAFTAIRGRGVRGLRRNLLTGEERPLLPQPSTAGSIRGGFAQIARFFPTAKRLLAEVEEELVARLFGEGFDGEVLLFEDQYISSGGQLYELLMGHDRFTADLREAASVRLRRKGLTGHPYDLCAHLIGEEAGLIITDIHGNPLDAPLDTGTAVDWIAYANTAIRQEVEPALHDILREKGLLPGARREAAPIPAAAPAAAASAPGRLDVMGGVADYSGSLLLQMPVARQVTVTVHPRHDGRFRLNTNRGDDKGGAPQAAEVPLTVFYGQGGVLLSGEEFRRQVAAHTSARWPLYVLGCFHELMRTHGLVCRGADVQIHSELPAGIGVASTAALGVAALRAITQLHGLTLPGLELPILAQQVGHHLAGTPREVADVLTSCLGQPEHLLPIRCQPAEVLDPVYIPEGIYFGGIDSGFRNTGDGDPYHDARTAAFMGYSIIAHAEGADAADLREALRNGDRQRLPFGGYLANIDPGEFYDTYSALLPERLRGADFLAGFGPVIDPYTSVHPDREYAVSVCTRHPIEENRRIQSFRDQLLRWEKIANHEAVLQQLGAYMLASHRSYSAMGLGSDRTDELVEALLERGPFEGIYGARVTGDGGGGTVCVLCFEEEGVETAREVAAGFGDTYGYAPALFNLDI